MIQNAGSDLPFCDPGSIEIADVPPGWELAANYSTCEWELVDAAGGRAPAEVYATIAIDPPSPSAVDRAMIGYALMVIGLGGIVAVLVVGGRAATRPAPRSSEVSS